MIVFLVMGKERGEGEGGRERGEFCSVIFGGGERGRVRERKRNGRKKRGVVFGFLRRAEREERKNLLFSRNFFKRQHSNQQLPQHQNKQPRRKEGEKSAKKWTN